MASQVHCHIPFAEFTSDSNMVCRRQKVASAWNLVPEPNLERELERSGIKYRKIWFQMSELELELEPRCPPPLVSWNH